MNSLAIVANSEGHTLEILMWVVVLMIVAVLSVMMYAIKNRKELLYEVVFWVHIALWANLAILLGWSAFQFAIMLMVVFAVGRVLNFEAILRKFLDDIFKNEKTGS